MIRINEQHRERKGSPIGYTHYWTFGDDVSQENYLLALADCRKIIKKLTKEYSLCGGLSEQGTKPRLSEGLAFNGCEDNGHETFWLDEVPLLSEFNFCKTACKPYDSVVTACLVALKDRLGDDVDVSSDGDTDDWAVGMVIAADILDRCFVNPIKD